MTTLEDIDRAIEFLRETGTSSRVPIPLIIAKQLVEDARRYRALPPLVRDAGEALTQ